MEIPIPLMSCLASSEDPSFQDEAVRLHRTWLRSGRSAGSLFEALGKAAERRAPAVRNGWAAWAEAVAPAASLMAPMELARAFSIDEVFCRGNYRARSTFIARMRHVSPPPKPAAGRARQSRQHAMPMHAGGIGSAQAAEPQPGMQPQQLQQQRQQQCRDPAVEELMRRQQMMMEQQDPWSLAAREYEITPLPREFLTATQLARARALVSRQRVDLRTEEAVVLKARDVDEAVLLSCLLAKERRCDLFRGQALGSWTPTPSIHRTATEREIVSARWRRYEDWARTQARLAAYDGKQLGAIAQHYGEPTYLLDFTYNPRIAAFFATHVGETAPAGDAVLFCLSSAGIRAAYHHAQGYLRYYGAMPQVTHVDVEGLLRMQAQEGTFVQCNASNWTDYYALDRVEFPRGPALTAPAEADIYPVGLSPVEKLVERFFARLGA